MEKENFGKISLDFWITKNSWFWWFYCGFSQWQEIFTKKKTLRFSVSLCFIFSHKFVYIYVSWQTSHRITISCVIPWTMSTCKMRIREYFPQNFITIKQQQKTIKIKTIQPLIIRKSHYSWIVLFIFLFFLMILFDLYYLFYGNNVNDNPLVFQMCMQFCSHFLYFRFFSAKFVFYWKSCKYFYISEGPQVLNSVVLLCVFGKI